MLNRVLLVVFIVGLCAATCWGEETKPNIVLVLIDDLGWQDSSVEFGEATRFQKHFRTPHLARLSVRGIRFSNAYSHAVCSPTRTSIMLGQNPARHRVTNWTLWSDKDTSGKTKRLLAPKDWRKSGIQPSDVTLPKRLQSGGYFTIHCGKAHWGAYGTEGADPTRLGFDVNIAGHPAGAPASYHGKKNFGNNADGSHKKPWGVPGLQKYHGKDIHLTDALTNEACDALKQAKKSGKPFFLYFAPYAVHAPIQEHGRFIKNYRGKKYPGTDIKIPEVEAKYASLVEGYDSAIGQILKAVEELGEAKNTIVIFTSDNGGLSVHARSTTPYGTGKNTHNQPLREGKGSAYEGGTRVPLLVAWIEQDPQNKLQSKIKIQPGSKSNAHVICEDLFPTICAWAGVKPQQQKADETTTNDLDGVNITDFVVGKKQKESRPLLFHYPHVWGPKGRGYQPHSALRWGDYKIIYFYEREEWELYNLVKDVGEKNNLLPTEKQIALRLANKMVQLLTTRKAQFPLDREKKVSVKINMAQLKTDSNNQSHE